jgi:hypothetical protein
MASIYVIYDERTHREGIRVPEIDGISYAATHLAPDYEFTPDEIKSTAERLTVELLKLVKP